MTCQDCGSRMPVDKVVPLDGVTIRIHTCPCGSRFQSDQRISARLPAATRNQGRPPMDTGSHGQTPVATRGHPQPAVSTGTPADGRGVGGALPSGSPSDPDPSLPGDPDRARARSKYPAEFESGWEGTAKTGSKHRAHAAWKRHGRPSADVVKASWDQWARTDQWRRGIVPHVSTWINGRCFEQEPNEVLRVGPVQALPDPRCSFHRLPNTRGKAARAPLASCPECKHAAAAQRGRESEPTPAAAIVPATREQLAALRPPKQIKVVIQQPDGSEQPVDLEATG